MLDMDVMIDSHKGNVSFKGAIGTKQGLRNRSVHGFVAQHKPITNNPSPQGAYTRPIRIIERDATGVGNMN